MSVPTPTQTPVEGVVADGAVVTYLLAIDPSGRPVQMGAFPHAPMWNARPFVKQCEATITVTDVDGDLVDRCTREVGHTGVHVSHYRPGAPTLAWLETRPNGGQS